MVDLGEAVLSKSVLLLHGPIHPYVLKGLTYISHESVQCCMCDRMYESFPAPGQSIIGVAALELVLAVIVVVVVVVALMPFLSVNLLLLAAFV